MRVDAVVVGAGLTGLVCALRLQRAGRRVALLEASSRTGGNVWTARDDGAVRELGPNAFGDGSAPLVRLADELGLTDRVVRAPDFAGRRFLFTRGRLRRVP